jgi:hypothetical protein
MSDVAIVNGIGMAMKLRINVSAFTWQGDGTQPACLAAGVRPTTQQGDA